MKWSRLRLKTYIFNPSDTNQSNLNELTLFCAFHEKSSLAPTRSTEFRHFTATDARFCFREFSGIRKQFREKTKQNKQNKTKTKNLTTFLSLLLGSSDRHMRIVIFRSISHHSLGLKRSRSQTLFRGEHLFVDGTHKTVSKQKDIK